MNSLDKQIEWLEKEINIYKWKEDIYYINHFTAILESLNKLKDLEK